MSGTIFRILLGVSLLCFAGWCPKLQGQLLVSTIRGTVVDASGLAVKDVEITVVNLGTNIRRSVRTNEAGDFEVVDILNGVYRLTTTQPGFKTFVADNIIVEGNQVRRIDIRLEVGALASEVTVEANAAVITTDTAKVQASVTAKSFLNAPWTGDGRNPYWVLMTMPLVQASGSGYSMQIAGLPSLQVQSAFDGVGTDSAGFQGNYAPYMQEVTVVTGSNSAEYSRPGYISFVSKGGSNGFHGTAEYWHQNSVLAARDFFAAKKPVLRFHTMTTEVSGPVRKDKTFFFFLWMGQRWPASTFYLRDVPTNPMRQGDFSQLLGLSNPIAIKDPTTGGLFPGNVIPASRMNTTSAAAMQKYLPGPNLGSSTALANNYGFLFPWPTDLYSVNGFQERIDHKLSEKNTIFGRLEQDKPLYVLAGNYPAFAWTRVRSNLSLVIQDTHIFSPGLVNSFRFGLYRPDVDDGETLGGVTPIKGDQVVHDLGIQGVNPKNLSAEGFPAMNITGYSALTEQPGGVNTNLHVWDYADSLTWAKGSHILKFGADFRPQSNFTGQVPTGSYGSFNFTGSYTGYPFADFLLGLPNSSTRLNPLTNRTQLDNEIGFYAQDTFKVSARITLDLGLRWQRFGSADYADGLVYNWDPATGDVLIPNRALTSISPLYPVNTIKVVTGPSVQSPSLHNFSPRLGIAYRPFGDKFVVRGGYGIYTETLGAFARAQGGGPYQLTETFFNSIQNGQPLFAFPNAFPGGAGNIPSQSVSGFAPDTNNGQIHQFSATIERQIRDMGVRLSYQGTRSRNLNYNIELDKPQPSLTPFSASRNPYPQFVSTLYARHNGAANFNALTFDVQRKIGQITFDGSWTWTSNLSKMLNLQNPYAPLVWNRDAVTVHHRVVGTAVYDLPFGHGQRILSTAPGLLNQFIGGWRLYLISTMETGQYFSPSFSGSDPSNTNTIGGLPNRVCNGNLPAGQRTVNHWFNPSCFTIPTPGTFGNSGVNILEGPGRNQQDLTLSKTFPIGERFKFTLGSAATNLLNHPNFWNPAANISVPGSVGVVNMTKGQYATSRTIMLRGRLEF